MHTNTYMYLYTNTFANICVHVYICCWKHINDMFPHVDMISATFFFMLIWYQQHFSSCWYDISNIFLHVDMISATFFFMLIWYQQRVSSKHEETCWVGDVWASSCWKRCWYHINMKKDVADNISTGRNMSPHVHMGWLRSVGSIKLQVSFVEYRLVHRGFLQKRPII